MKSRLQLLAILVVGVFLVASYSQGAIRDLTHDEMVSTVGSAMHCVVMQPEDPPVGCEDCAATYCTDTCWRHQDERCECGPPQQCSGHSSYKAFSKTCNDCSLNFWSLCGPETGKCTYVLGVWICPNICDDEGDYNGDSTTIYRCY